jgi:hypothetical protein
MIDEEIDSMDQDEEGIVPTEDEADTIGCWIVKLANIYQIFQ